MRKTFMVQPAKEIHPRTSPKSFVSLMSVIVIGTVGMVIALSLLLIGTDSLKSINLSYDSSRARNYADGCVERALNSIRADQAYAGPDTYSFDYGSCEVLGIINAGTETPTIHVEGISKTATKRIEVIISAVKPQITIGTWREVAVF